MERRPNAPDEVVLGGHWKPKVFKRVLNAPGDPWFGIGQGAVKIEECAVHTCLSSPRSSDPGQLLEQHVGHIDPIVGKPALAISP
jgi:hypothetical protein